MRSFLASLERRRIPYLLISGQACVLYGASQFTEDVDLWVRPEAGAWRSFLRSLAEAGGLVHKLTPPLSLENLRRGHGFHFLIPPDAYLDVMGRPPRVESFPAALRRARRLDTDWGTLPVAAPEDLVLLKRTNRPADYEAISNLVRIRVEETPRDPRVLRWAMLNTFDVDDLQAFASRVTAWPRRPALRALFPLSPSTSAIPDARRRRATRLLALQAADVQEQGRRYWLPILRELKKLHAGGTLLKEGTPVAELL